MSDGVVGVDDLRLKVIRVLGYDVLLSSCLIINFLVFGFFRYVLKGFVGFYLSYIIVLLFYDLIY